jgi:uncharacterized protein YjiS (DUF1127 family)
MAIETGAAPGSAWRFPALIAEIPRFIRAVLQSRRAETELNALSDHFLQDIGVGRQDISELVRREIARDSLLGTGWRKRR